MRTYKLVYTSNPDGEHFFITYEKNDEEYYLYIDKISFSLEMLLSTIKSTYSDDDIDFKWIFDNDSHLNIDLIRSDDLESILNLSSIDNPELFI